MPLALVPPKRHLQGQGPRVWRARLAQLGEMLEQLGDAELPDWLFLVVPVMALVAAVVIAAHLAGRW